MSNQIPAGKRQSRQRIFISYRRDDTQWAAGRLADSLSAYFGDDRVFRDIEGIAGGADFGQVIEQTLETADAVILMIGRNWLDAKDDRGGNRLDDPDDWVVQELAAALDRGVPVYPVLIDGAPMPRSEELPESLKPLTRFNAITVSDDRWATDVTRLASIIALDIPSQTERQLQRVNLAVSLSLLLSIVFTLSVIYANLLTSGSTAVAVGSGVDQPLEHDWPPARLFARIEGAADTGGGSTAPGNPRNTGDCADVPESWVEPLSTAQSGIIFLVVVPVSALLFVFARHVDPGRRGYFNAAAWAGSVGSFVAFVLFYLVCAQYETAVISYLGLIVAPLMLVLLGLSGFKPR